MPETNAVTDSDDLSRRREKSSKRLLQLARELKLERQYRGCPDREYPRDPGLALVLGSGVSLQAGVPLGRGWVPLLWRFRAGQAIEQERHVKPILYIQKTPGYGYASYGDEFIPFADLACKEVHEYRELLERHPRDYVKEYTALMGSMQPETQRRAVDAILKACGPLTLTWSYIRIAQLVAEGWVDTILTTNLDLVLLETLSLFGLFPAVCDYHEAAVLRSSHAGEPQIIYLHGNRNSYNVRNTDSAVAKYTGHMQTLLRGLLDDRILLVSGYSGWNDGLMEILRSHFKNTNVKRALYWAFAGRRAQPLPLDSDRPLGSADHVWYLEEQPAEELFETLAQFLDLPRAPPLVADPIGHFVNLMKRIDPKAPQVQAFDLAGRIRQLETLPEHYHAAAAKNILEAAQRDDDHGLRATARDQRLEPSQIGGLIASILGTEMRDAKSVLASVTALLDEVSQQLDFAVSPDWDRAFWTIMREGDRQITRGNLAAALAAYDAGQELARKLATCKPDNTQWQRDLGVSYDKIGGVRKAQGQLPEALQAYNKRLVIARKLAEQEPHNPKFQRDMGVSHERIGDVLKHQEGGLTKALHAYEERMRIAKKLADQDPDNTEWQRDLSVSYNKIGDVLEKDKDTLHAALNYYQKSWDIVRKLADRDPHNTEWQRDLSISLERIGEVRKAQEDLPAALKAYEDALDIREKLAAHDLKNTYWQWDHAMGHENVAAVHSKLGNQGLARRHLLEASTIMERLVNLNPSHAQWTRDAETMRGKLKDLGTPYLPMP